MMSMEREKDQNTKLAFEMCVLQKNRLLTLKLILLKHDYSNKKETEEKEQ